MSKPPAPAPSEWCAKCRHSRPHHEWPDGKCRAAADTDNECCECVEYEAQIPAPAPAPSGVLTREEYVEYVTYESSELTTSILLAHDASLRAEVERLRAGTLFVPDPGFVKVKAEAKRLRELIDAAPHSGHCQSRCANPKLRSNRRVGRGSACDCFKSKVVK